MSNKFKMSLSLNVLNHLGINLYSNIPAVLSEIVANSWDADAENVYISITNDEIIISDDGLGMDTEDINNKFLYVGHRKKERGNLNRLYTKESIWEEKESENSLCFPSLKKLMFIQRKNLQMVNMFLMD